MNYTYLLQCADNTYYCGWTNDLDKRVKTHNEGRGARYTRCRRPVVLVHYEEFASREEAMKRECAIKKLNKKQKQQLIESGNKLIHHHIVAEAAAHDE